eukprot:CAMPEP_0182797104 /NCGR_PEP_ID=MMETSP0006_2-20121128/631_1 /TAXON_ID=97485 /ORGANISM="Prymnesium parvum, Strain Texoma1" /LENGTH=61 /DNA_ID=CAMNT_0024922117 /DNA_START=435 /DNA_END=617 /DNA_ORIENTATION=-
MERLRELRVQLRVAVVPFVVRILESLHALCAVEQRAAAARVDKPSPPQPRLDQRLQRRDGL